MVVLKINAFLQNFSYYSQLTPHNSNIFPNFAKLQTGLSWRLQSLSKERQGKSGQHRATHRLIAGSRLRNLSKEGEQKVPQKITSPQPSPQVEREKGVRVKTRGKSSRPDVV